MSTDVHTRCFGVLSNLRFNWTQYPQVVLHEALKTVGLDSDYLKTDPELFEFYRKQLYQKLKKRYHPLLALLVPAHFIWQINMINCRPTDDQTYERVRKAIFTPQPNDKYDYKSVMRKR